MTDVPTKLTVDEAVAEFFKMANALLGSAPTGQTRPTVPETFEEAEARRFRLAKHVLSLACPDPRTCQITAAAATARADILWTCMLRSGESASSRQPAHSRRVGGALCHLGLHEQGRR